MRTKFETLQAGILALSEEKEDWMLARDEWKATSISYEEEGEVCLCGQHINVLCSIRNTKNSNEALVGSKCIKQFLGRDAIAKAMDQLRVLRLKLDRTTPSLLMRIAMGMGVFKEREIQFLRDIRRKRKLSDKQRQWRIDLHSRIIKAFQ